MDKEYVTHEESRESLLDSYKVIVDVLAESVEEAEDKAIEEIEWCRCGYFEYYLEVDEVE